MKQELQIIGRIRTDFPTKFGLPRQGEFCRIPDRQDYYGAGVP